MRNFLNDLQEDLTIVAFVALLVAVITNFPIIGMTLGLGFMGGAVLATALNIVKHSWIAIAHKFVRKEADNA